MIREILKSEDVKYFTAHIRALDKRECDIFDYTVSEHLLLSWKLSSEAKVLADREDNPIAFAGVIPQYEKNFIWLLTTDLADIHKKEFVSFVKKQVEYAAKKYGKLSLLTDKRYKQALNLNEHMGFNFIKDEIINKHIFAYYERC